MDRQELADSIPDARSLDEWNKAKRQQAVQDALVLVFDAIEGDDRGPDGWESDNLADALGLYAIGWHYAALSAVRHALIPPEQRSKDVTFKDAPISVAVLRRALLAVVAVPI